MRPSDQLRLRARILDVLPEPFLDRLAEDVGIENPERMLRSAVSASVFSIWQDSDAKQQEEIRVKIVEYLGRKL